MSTKVLQNSKNSDFTELLIKSLFLLQKPLFMRFLKNFNDTGSTVQNYLLNDSGSSEGSLIQVQVLLSAPVESLDTQFA